MRFCAGGIGTLAEAFAAAIPHLIMPLGHDQPDNARRVNRLGAGDVLLPKRFTGEAVAATLAPLLSDEPVQTRCAALADRVDFANALYETCDLIEALSAPSG
jgi:rhamnosyltransferase subunit B